MKISITKQEMDLAMAQINANTFVGKCGQQSNEAWGLPIFSKLTFDKPADVWKDQRIKGAIAAVKAYAKKNDYTFATPDQIKHNEATLLSKLFNDADSQAKGWVAVAANPKIEGHDGINFFSTMVSLKARRAASNALIATGAIEGALIGFYKSRICSRSSHWRSNWDNNLMCFKAWRVYDIYTIFDT